MTELGKQIQVELYKKSTDNINPMQREEVKDKLKNTIRQKYGVDNVMSLIDFRNKAKNTTKELYGKENYFSTTEFIKNNTIRRRENYYDFLQIYCIKNDFELLFDKKSYSEWELGNEIAIKCLLCGEVIYFSEKLPITRLIRCSCRSHDDSVPEGELFEWLSSVTKCSRHDRKLLKNRELDIVSHEKKIAVEFNGIYWHSDKNGKDKNYHLDKTNRCEELGYHLIHVFEDEWREKQRIVKNRLKSVFGLCDSKIFARKCDIHEVNDDLCKKFLTKYHIQGYATSSKRYGLFYKGKLVALMTFGKPRFAKDVDWELIRYCSIGSFNVVGGAGKLLSHFKKHHTGSIITYADRRWSVGNLYEKIGFIFIRNSEPNYYYVKNYDRISRYAAQKHKLSKLLGENFNPSLTERENMELNGYGVIWDCGNKVYKLES